MKEKKLFLIDAYALIYRAYYAFIKNPRINSKGFDTSAIMGFFNSIFDIIKMIFIMNYEGLTRINC